jgi:hypothetical protein
MEELPKYKANPAFVGLGNKPPQPFVRGDSIYSPSGPQGSRIVASETLFNFSNNGFSSMPQNQSSSSSITITSSGASLGSPP